MGAYWAFLAKKAPKYDTDKDFLYIEFAKIESENAETGKIEEIEVRSRLKLPIEDALDTLFQFVQALTDHEAKFKTGYGLTLPESEKAE